VITAHSFRAGKPLALHHQLVERRQELLLRHVLELLLEDVLLHAPRRVVRLARLDDQVVHAELRHERRGRRRRRLALARRHVCDAKTRTSCLIRSSARRSQNCSL